MDARTAKNEEAAVNRALLWAVCGILIAVFGVVDLITPRLLYHACGFAWWAAVLLGLCVAQVNLIAVWAALAPGNIVIRLAWSLLLAAGTWYALVLGDTHADGRCYIRGPSDAVLLGETLLAAVVILQVPLWIAKKGFRRRLSRGVSDAEQFVLEDRQFQIKHMLWAMFFWAVALSPLRMVLPPGKFEPLRIDSMFFVMLGAFVVCNLLLTIPCIWWAFVSTARPARLVLAWLLYCAVLTIAVFAVPCALFGPPAEGLVMAASMFFIINVTQCAAVFGILRIFRAMGFRLVRFTEPQAMAGST